MGTYQGKHALIFASAPENEYGYITRFLRDYPDCVVACADGGLRHALAMGLSPDLVVGDFDSTPPCMCEGAEILRLRPEKDDTDTQSCLRELFNRGCTMCTLVCATGGRLDHTLANLSLLEEAHVLGGRCAVLDRQNYAVLHEGGTQQFKMPADYQYFSILPLDAIIEDVTIEGAKYPLLHAAVRRSAVISISNEPICETFTISISKGSAMILFARDGFTK